MTGVTQLHNVLYVVCLESSIIAMYTADTLSSVADIHVEGMKDPRDIVVCRHDRQLYVADCDYCIWRVSVDDHSYVKWLPQSSTDKFHVWTLSVTSRRLLVTSRDPPTVHQYNTTNKELLCVVQIPQYVKCMLHAVETTHNTFVISHRGTSQDKQQYAVSELFRFCHSLVILITTTYYFNNSQLTNFTHTCN